MGESLQSKLDLLTEALTSCRNNAGYDAAKADTRRDRKRFEHIYKIAQQALNWMTRCEGRT